MKDSESLERIHQEFRDEVAMFKKTDIEVQKKCLELERKLHQAELDLAILREDRSLTIRKALAGKIAEMSSSTVASYVFLLALLILDILSKLIH